MAGEHCQRDGSQHEDDGAPGGNARKNGSGSARTKSGLAAHSAKGGSDVSALAVLQQHHHNEDGANDYVNDGDQDGHAVPELPFKTYGAEGGI